MRLAKKGKKNSNDIVWFYPERALEKTVLLLAYTVVHDQGQGKLLALQKAPKHR